MKWYSSKLYTRLYARFVLRRFKDDPKKRDELAHWIGQAFGKDENDHFRYFYSEEFGLKPDFFVGKRLLDVGCGPVGSLEWISGAKSRVGIDPLAREYLWLGAWKQKMKYIACGAEKMPFLDENFDLIFCFNALDHVDDLAAASREISRVLARKGLLLLITDCNHPPTITEPTELPENLAENFFDGLELADRHFYKHTRLRIYDSLREERVEIDGMPNGSHCIMKLALKK